MGFADIFKTKEVSTEFSVQTEKTVQNTFAPSEQTTLEQRSTELFTQAPYESVTKAAPAPPEVSVQKDKGKHQLMPATIADTKESYASKRVQAQKRSIAENVPIDEGNACVDEEMKQAFALMKQYAGLQTDSFSSRAYKDEEDAVRNITAILEKKELELTQAAQNAENMPAEAAALLKMVRMYRLFFSSADGLLELPGADQTDMSGQQYKDLCGERRAKRTAIGALRGEIDDSEKIKQDLLTKQNVKDSLSAYEQLKEDYEKEFQRFGGSPEDVGSTDQLEAMEKQLNEFKSKYIKPEAVAAAGAKLEQLKKRLEDAPDDAGAQAELEKQQAEYDVMQYFVISEKLKTDSARLLELQADFDRFRAAFPKQLYKSHSDAGMTLGGPKLVDTVDKTKEKLFPHRPSIADVQQGELGDCYVLSALSSVVSENPELIEKMMRDNGDGTVTVRFFYEDVFYSSFDGSVLSSTVTPQYVTVKKETPLKQGDDGQKYEPYAQRALWVQMIERAYVTSKLHIKYNQKNLEKKEYLYDRLGKSADYQAEHDKLMNRFYDTAKADYTDIAGGDEGDFTFLLTGRKAKSIRSSEQVENRRLDLMLSNVMAREGNLALQGKTSGVFKGDAGIDSGIAQQKASVQDEYNALDNAIKTDLANLPGVKTFKNKDKTKANLVVLGSFVNSDMMQQYLLDHRVALINAIPLRTWITDPKKQQSVREQVFDNLVTQLVEEAKRDDVFTPFSQKDYSDNAEDTFAQVEQAIAAGEIVTCGTQKYIPDEADISGGGLNAESMSGGIIEGHAYTVLGTKTSDNGYKYVKLRNPWASTVRAYIFDEDTNTVTGQQKKQLESDGVFYLELNDFMSRFNQVQRN